MKPIQEYVEGIGLEHANSDLPLETVLAKRVRVVLQDAETALFEILHGTLSVEELVAGLDKILYKVHEAGQK